MPVRIECRNPDCRLSFGVSAAGRIGRCPSCGSAVDEVDGTDLGTRVPDPGTTSRLASLGRPTSLGFAGAGSPWDITRGSVFGGRYRIERKLGAGGMGAVYLAEDTRLKRLVALKVPHPHLFEGDPGFLDRLYREAQIAATFHHPNICPIHDVDHSGDWYYIVMHYIEGETLSEILRRRSFDAEAACRMVRTVALTLQQAHARGIIHRDLKPSNLMVRPDGSLVIMDFGLAKWFEGEGDENFKTSDGTFLGTLVYAPPEQVEGRIRELGPGCDIYTLGVILYELLTGRLPFQGSQFLLWEQILRVAPEPPSVHAEGIGPELDAIVLRALDKKVSGRFATMDELAGTLDAYLGARPTPGPSTGVETRLLPDPPPPTSTFEHHTPGSSDDFELVPDGSEPAVPTPAPQPAPELDAEFASRSTGMILVRIPPGEFLMGSTDGEPDERPPHPVRLSHGFYLGRRPVTQREYATVVGGRGPSHFRGNPENPVEQVSWLDAAQFCNALGALDGLAPFYRIDGRSVAVVDWRGRGYRLPTEAEWEYACRAGRTSRFGFGDDEARLGGYAWYAANSGRTTHPVGGKRPNAWGLTDLHGNVWEWCWDWYDPDYYPKQANLDPRGPEADRKFRVLRGGHCGEDAPNLRSARRRWFEPSIRFRYIGLRLARTAD